MYWLYRGKMLLCISTLYWVHLGTWFGMRGGRTSVWHIETYVCPDEENQQRVV